MWDGLATRPSIAEVPYLCRPSFRHPGDPAPEGAENDLSRIAPQRRPSDRATTIRRTESQHAIAWTGCHPVPRQGRSLPAIDFERSRGRLVSRLTSGATRLMSKAPLTSNRGRTAPVTPLSDLVDRTYRLTRPAELLYPLCRRARCPSSIGETWMVRGMGTQPYSSRRLYHA